MQIFFPKITITASQLSAIILVVTGILFRLIPHPPNMAPMAAIALLAGSMFGFKQGLLIVVGSMIVSDLFIGLHGLIGYTWGAYALTAFLGFRFLSKNRTGIKLLGVTLSSSLLFFVISNFGVWVEGRLYAHTVEGIVQTFIMALPFYRNTVLGDLLFVGLLFGLYEGVHYLAKNHLSGRQFVFLSVKATE